MKNEKKIEEIFSLTQEPIKDAVMQNAMEMTDFLFGKGGSYGTNFPKYWRIIRHKALLGFQEFEIMDEEDIEAIRMMDDLIDYCRKFREMELVSPAGRNPTSTKELTSEILNQ